jgi:enoyl-[acyl-carrier protein] reductase II
MAETRPAPVRNRVTEALGVDYPIVQAPMGWIARAQLASAVSNAGGLGIIETSSGELDAVREEIRKMRDLTDRPFGVNIAQLFVRDPGIVDFVIEQGVRFVTTSAGDPTKYTKSLKGSGLTVYHVVPSLRAALKAIEAGVDGLVVEGGEGGGFKNPRDVATMVLLPLVCSRVNVPIIAADGPPESDPLGERVSESVLVRQAVPSAPIFRRRLVRQAAVRTGVVVVLPPGVQRPLGVLETREPVL